MPEENELVWDDSVAPETCVDFDAPHVPTSEVFMMIAGAFAALFGIYSFVEYYDARATNPVATRSAVLSEKALRTHLGLSDSEDGQEEEEEEEDDDE